MSNVQLHGPWRALTMPGSDTRHEIIDSKGQRVCEIDFHQGQPEMLSLLRAAPNWAGLLMAWCEGCTGVKPSHGALLGQTAQELNIIAHSLMGEEDTPETEDQPE